MKRVILSLCFVLCCVLAPGAQGQVFTLWPSSGGNGDSSNPLGAEAFSTEPVIINGVECEMKLALVYQNLNDLALSIREHFKDGQVAAAGNNLLVTMPADNGRHWRYLYIALRPGLPVLQISMKLPVKLPENFVWPRRLPILPNATPFRVMLFPKRDAAYGAFHFPPGSTAEALDQITAAAGDNWARMAHEEANLGRASGEILIRKNPPSIMLVNFTKEGVGVVYTRPLKK